MFAAGALVLGSEHHFNKGDHPMLIRLACVVVCLLLSACTTFVEWPWAATERSQKPGNESIAAICSGVENKCTPADARQALSTASNYCSKVLNKHNGSRALFGSSKMAIGTMGALSGSVLAQFAQGTAAQAWSGVSGVANGMQNQMDQAFAGALDVKRQQEIALAALAGEEKYRLEADNEKKVALAMRMALDCAVSAAKSNARAMDAVTGVAGSTVVPLSTGQLIPTWEVQGDRVMAHYSYPSVAQPGDADAVATSQAIGICKSRQYGGAKSSGHPRAICTSDAMCEVSAAFTCVK